MLGLNPLKLPSVMQKDFSRQPQADIPRSMFDRSHGYSTTFDAGKLIPFYVDEVYPGDTFSMNTSAVCRMNTPLTPVMDNLYLDTFYFFVPYRLVWDNWQKFCGEQEDPGDSTDFTTPVVSYTGNLALHQVADYFGLPIGHQPSDVSALPFRAYKLIWNEWFRDQNLQDSQFFSRGNGPDSIGAGLLPLPRGKRHDYFTSCLPWAQKSDSGSVILPLGTTAPVTGLGVPTGSTTVNTPQNHLETGGGTPSYANYYRTDLAPGGINASGVNGNPLIFADLSSATAATINQIREAFQIQRMYERDARGGTRYIEILKSHFGVTSPDFRLQRPEYLGGGNTPIYIKPIPQTSESGTTPQGTLTGYGEASFSGHGFSSSFVEHGVVIGMMSVRADLRYQQGIERFWSRQTRFDYYWPGLAHLGEQAVLNREIYYDGTAADDDVFGYQERWAELRYKQSTITGQLRSTAASSLDIWHLAQEFTTRPLLDDTFIEDNPPVDRVVATPAEPQFIIDMYHKLICARPLPTYGVPGMVDHF